MRHSGGIPSRYCNMTVLYQASTQLSAVLSYPVKPKRVRWCASTALANHSLPCDTTSYVLPHVHGALIGPDPRLLRAASDRVLVCKSNTYDTDQPFEMTK